MKFLNTGHVVLSGVPEDVLSAIPVEGIANGPMGDEPRDFWGQIAAHVTNAVVSAVSFIANAIVAVGNFIAHAAEVIANTAMQVFNTVANAVKAAVKVIADAVNAILKWIKDMIAKLVKNMINPLFNRVKQAVYNMGKEMYNLASKGKEAMQSYFVTHILPVVMGVGIGIYAFSIVVGHLIDGLTVAGAAILGAITAGLTVAILTTIMTSEYYERGKNMDTSVNGIKNWLHSVNPALSTAYSSVVDFLSPLFLMDLLGDESGKATVKALGIYFISIFASMAFIVAQPPTPTTGTAMIPFLALASVSGGNTVITAFKGFWSGVKSGDWGTAIALGAIGLMMGVSVTMTVSSDMGYVVDAFT